MSRGRLVLTSEKLGQLKATRMPYPAFYNSTH